MKLGIDIGGTFTDLVLLNEADHKIYFGKTLTTYPDPTLGIISGIHEITAKNSLPITDITSIVHGTTLVTNAIIERKGAKTGLLTTKGFEDVLEIGREMRYDIYDIFITMPKPLIPSALRVGIDERMNNSGQIIKSLNVNQVREKIRFLVNKGVKSIAVSYLHSYANAQHEQITGQLLSDEFPEITYSLSSDVMPEIREYERTSATAMNAYVQPLTHEYLTNLIKKLNIIGFFGKLHIMDSAGRLTTVEGAVKTPVQLLESGPAGGTMAGVFFGHMIDKKDLLAFDMGGTTAKASMIRDLEPEITNHFEAAREKRFKKGSGLPVRIPVIDMIEIGAGGGSIAYINHLGLLTVGPESASSTPGPACYGRGGEHPTVTDADLILGFLNADFFLGGSMTLNKEAAISAMKNKIADPLGIAVEAAAWGIHRIVNENMANAARVHIIEKGLDPRFFSMLAFGGAGPVHAFHVARLMNAPQLIIPAGAGVLSALGFLVSPVAKEEIFSYISVLENLDWERVNDMISTLTQKGKQFVMNAGIHPDDIKVNVTCDMRYTGQGHDIHVKMPNGTLGKASMEEIIYNFKKEYSTRYGRIIEGIPVEAITWRVLVKGPSPRFIPKQAGIESGATALKESRNVFWGQEFVNTPVYERYALTSDMALKGPCIIEEHESTTVVGKNANVRVDEFKNIIIEMEY
jgi:N-methylhydantoinase A